MMARRPIVTLAVFRTATAVVGGRLYTLQRDHVRTLIRRSIRTTPAAPEAHGNRADSGPVGTGPVVSGPAGRPSARSESPFRWRAEPAGEWRWTRRCPRP